MAIQTMSAISKARTFACVSVDLRYSPRLYGPFGVQLTVLLEALVGYDRRPELFDTRREFPDRTARLQSRHEINRHVGRNPRRHSAPPQFGRTVNVGVRVVTHEIGIDPLRPISQRLLFS